MVVVEDDVVEMISMERARLSAIALWMVSPHAAHPGRPGGHADLAAW